ncbi:MAG: uracil-DNA glycosylase [Thaumarchaeota archaeon]|nr:MAG: uracil-DNA glycosylase [Nitrososphaerota archaeon]TLX94947.1 MAG: uracil-DNA glycosylase [Nitrososphaerota archaeon]
MSEEIIALRKRVMSCIKCGLSKSRKNAVPGSGNIQSEIIFIGEAPGRSEDLQGEPFVGTAGQILSEALEYAGLKRSDIYITNVVKCRPPNNRQPLKEEQDACREHLLKELEIIRPKMICILGNTAFSSLLNGNSITKNRGKIIHRAGQLYFVTIHPAAAIYNPDLRQVLKDDMKFLAQTLDKIKKGLQIETLE